jgi:hypothetical protein
VRGDMCEFVGEVRCKFSIIESVLEDWKFDRDKGFNVEREGGVVRKVEREEGMEDNTVELIGVELMDSVLDV